MRIRRTVLAPAILTIGATSALVVGPVLAVATAAPAGTAVAVSPMTDIIISHG